MKPVFVATAFGVMAVVAACGDDGEDILSTSATPTTSATPGAREVSWDDAKQLLKDCRVTMVGQTHSLDVQLTLDDGTRVHTKEPGIDDVMDLAFDAQQRCGGQPEQIATE